MKTVYTQKDNMHFKLPFIYMNTVFNILYFIIYIYVILKIAYLINNSV